jgi:hypothetical protein
MKALGSISSTGKKKKKKMLKGVSSLQAVVLKSDCTLGLLRNSSINTYV